MRTCLLLAVLPGLLAACAAPKLPGTTITDTPENRAIVSLLHRYQDAYEKREAETLLSLASKRFMETGGTAGTEDDYDYDGLAERLHGEDFGRVLKARLRLDVKEIVVEGDRAHAEVRAETRYQTMPLAEGGEPEWHMMADDNRMEFVREDGEWKILSGM